MRYATLLVALALLSPLVGCGTADEPSSVNVTPPPATDSLKAALNDVIQSGQLGSGGMTIEQEIENLRASDAAKADALKADYEKLRTMGDPNQLKAKAQEMISKL
jgi:hypothetical protein